MKRNKTIALALLTVFSGGAGLLLYRFRLSIMDLHRGYLMLGFAAMAVFLLLLSRVFAGITASDSRNEESSTPTASEPSVLRPNRIARWTGAKAWVAAASFAAAPTIMMLTTATGASHIRNSRRTTRDDAWLGELRQDKSVVKHIPPVPEEIVRTYREQVRHEEG